MAFWSILLNFLLDSALKSIFTFLPRLSSMLLFHFALTHSLLQDGQPLKAFPAFPKLPSYCISRNHYFFLWISHYFHWYFFTSQLCQEYVWVISLSCHRLFPSHGLTEGPRPALLLIMADLIHTAVYFHPLSSSVLGINAFKPKKLLCAHPPPMCLQFPSGGLWFNSGIISIRLKAWSIARETKVGDKTALSAPLLEARAWVCLAELDVRLALWDVGV